MRGATVAWLVAGLVVIGLGLFVQSVGLMIGGFLLILVATLTEAGG